MFGELLSAVTKVVTIPIDIAEVGLDVASGGDGSKRSRETPLSEIRDEICDTMEDIDK